MKRKAISQDAYARKLTKAENKLRSSPELILERIKASYGTKPITVVWDDVLEASRRLARGMITAAQYESYVINTLSCATPAQLELFAIRFSREDGTT